MCIQIPFTKYAGPYVVTPSVHRVADTTLFYPGTVTVHADHVDAHRSHLTPTTKKIKVTFKDRAPELAKADRAQVDAAPKGE